MATKTPATEWQEPEDQAKKSGLGKWGRPSQPYDLFMDEQGIPIFRGIGVSKVQDLTLAPWKRMGGNGTFIQLWGTEGKWGMYVVEIPPAGALNPEKHLYEEIYLVVEGRGSTEVWRDGSNKKSTFEWSKGSLFTIPMNTQHRLVNATSGGALLLAGTTAPPVMNLFQSQSFIFNTPYDFTDRYDESSDYYKPNDDIEPDPVRGLAMRRTNIMPDIINTELPVDNRRSPGYRRAVHVGQQVLPVDRSARAWTLFEGSRPRLGRGAHLPTRQGLHVHVATGARHAPLGGRLRGPSAQAGLRARGDGDGGAHDRRLVPPALRHRTR